MSHHRPVTRGHRPRVGALAIRVGAAVLVGAVPLVVGAAVGLVMASATLSGAVETATLAVTEPPAQSRVALLFRIGALGTLSGSWLLGLGLVVDGLTD